MTTHSTAAVAATPNTPSNAALAPLATPSEANPAISSSMVVVAQAHKGTPAQAQKQDAGNHAVAGSMAGVLSKVVLQPMDLIKTRMQVQEASVAYRGMSHAFRSIWTEGGFRAFYTGLTPNLVGSGLSWGCYFFTYNHVKQFFRDHQQLDEAHNLDANGKPPALSPAYHMLSAATAGVATVLGTNPIWMIKTRIQLQTRLPAVGGVKPYNGILHAFRRIIAEEGLHALYRGMGPALTLVSNGALQFMAYEELRKVALLRVDGKEELLNPGHFLAMGALAKVFSTCTTYPLQVVRSRLYQQAAATASAVVDTPAAQTATQVLAQRRPGAKYDSASQVVSHVFRTEGVRGFYKGLVPQLFKTAPGSALTFMCYELILRATGSSRV